ncbi:hypothetical protein [Niveibacterium sp. SC-1]|uniref:response regulator n=1 Tax=Niveibacterium sp. SC-1 TaxID=3135646 RepID=UPI00311DBC6C
MNQDELFDYADPRPLYWVGRCRRLDPRLDGPMPIHVATQIEDEDDFVDIIDDEDDAHLSAAEPWRVLVVDDDPSVHAATRLALSRVSHRGRPVEVISAYSAREARACFLEQTDINVALIDVVMETDHAGLELARFVRDELGNQRVRLVIRTGQAGHFEESAVRRDYPVDDYCQKAELTASRLRDILSAQLDRF